MNIMRLFNGARHIRNVCAWVLLCPAWIVAGNVSGVAQPSPRSLLLGGSIGAGIYHGEFNSLQADFSLSPGFTTSLLLQYNLNEIVALGASLGYSSLHYSITDFARGKYASNFFGPVGNTTYPGSTVALTDQNNISISQLQLFGKLYLPHLLSEKYTPYALAGIGLINFTPTNANDETLPTNLTGPYSTTSLIIPLGGGVEYKISDKLTGWAEMTYHRNFTDYLDGYAHYIDYDFGTIPSGPGAQETQSDHFTTLRLGLSYKIYEDVPDPEPEPSSSPLASGGEPSPSGQPGSPPSQPEPTRGEQPIPEEQPADESTPQQPENRPTPERTNDAYRRDPNAPDSDQDNLSDEDEINRYGTNPYSKDSDNDGLTDGEEVALYNTDPLAADTDGDLLSDLSEVRRHGTNAREVDTDRDLLSDNEELARTGTDPLDPDTDGDGIFDGVDECPTLPGLPEHNGCPEDRLQPNEITSGTEPEPRTPLDPLEPGERREFSRIYFRQDSDDFDFSRPETGEELVELLNFLQECEDVGVLIEGHTSSEGSASRNMELSKMRAERVQKWLLANGVASDKLLGTVGYGSRMPKIAEPTRGNLSETSLERIRAQNRRITAVIRKPCR